MGIEFTCKDCECDNVFCDCNPDGWIVIAPGLPNMAYHYKSTAINECPGNGKVKSFKYIL